MKFWLLLFLIILTACSDHKSETDPAPFTDFESVVWKTSLTNSQRAFAMFSKNDKILFAFSKSDLMVSHDRGTTWKSRGNFPSSGGNPIVDLRVLAVCPSDTNIFLTCGRTSTFLMRSTNGGQTWTSVIDSVTSDGENIEFDLVNPAKVYFLSFEGGFYESNDTGRTWTKKSDIPDGRSCTMSLYPGNSNVILAGAGCEQITRSQDKGNTWTTVKSSSVACGEIPKIAFDLDDPNTIYGTVFGWPTPYSITKSTDGGLTWEYPERLTINDPFWSLTYNDEAKLIVAGTSTAVYASNDGGETWHTLGSKKPGFWMMKSSRRRILVTDGNTLFYGDIP